MKYYKKYLHNEIKELYFKHFGYLQIQDQIISGKFDSSFLSEIMFQPEIASKISEFKNQVLDYCHINTLVGLPKSLALQRIDLLKINAGEMIFHMMKDIDYITREVIEILRYSTKSCIVGGAVRDMLVGTSPKDFDFVTDIPYDTIIEIFENNNFEVKETGKTFRVITISKDEVSFEIANFRKDGTYVDGRRPETTTIGTIEDDADRRDFTINALYFNLTDLTVIDPTGLGLLDRSNYILRFVGKPDDRLKEDALRGWRFLRFLKKGLIPDKSSFDAVKRNWDYIYTKSNPSRVLSEQIKVLNR
jgi:hypothetical protein